MAKKNTQGRDSIYRRLRARWKVRQANLRAQFQREIGQIAPDDVVMSTRIKHKYRQLGLKF